MPASTIILRTALGLTLATTAMPAFAADPVSLDQKLYVERVLRDSSGKKRVALEPVQTVAPGDRVVFVVNYRNRGTQPKSGVVLTNPLPATIRFDGTADERALVSVDGGRSWGTLGDLTVTDRGRRRIAQRSDVTHVRWQLDRPLAPGASGKLVYRAIVR